MTNNTDQKETASHFSYKEYKKKVKKSPNRDIMVFASVFIIGLLIILGFAKILSPNVDVAISKEGDMIASEEDTMPSLVDERLRRLKQEDDGNATTDEDIFSPELDEKVVIPAKTHKTVGEIEAENKMAEAEQENPKEEEQTTRPQEPAPQAEQKPTAHPEKVVSAKVVVGYYATEKQAEVAKSIIQDAGLSVTPIVKNLGGYYTLQVGSYSSRDKAQQAANNLLKSNFPARVILD